MLSHEAAIQSIDDLGYDGKLLEQETFSEALKLGPKSDSFREIIIWITNEIHILGKTEEMVAKDTNFNEFMLELSGFLKEISCPYGEFVAGPLTSRFQSEDSKLLLLEYLISELMALKMSIKLTPEETSYIISMDETSTANALKTITKELNLGKPPDNIAPKALFDKISFRIDESIRKTNPKKLAQPLFKTTEPLTDVQWSKLKDLCEQFEEEYRLRRQMLLTRLEVTIQSFQWAEKMHGREGEIVSKYQKNKEELDQLQFGNRVANIPALLAARTDLAIIEKTSNANVRKNTASKIHKHVIGSVPDRGGRAYEHAPPPPEMPSWQQNRSSGSGPVRGGGGRGGQQSRGRGSQGGGNWLPMHSHSALNQRDSNAGGFKHQQYDRQQKFDQRQNNDGFVNRGNYGGGGERVQGGWSQAGGGRSGNNSYRGNNQYDGNRGGSNQRGAGNQRGTSNYHRGGGGSGQRQFNK